MSETTENWFKDGVHFECTACGKCCTVPQGFDARLTSLLFPGAAIDDEEVSVLAAHMNLPEAEFRERFVTICSQGFQAIAINNQACVFYDAETKLCKVHLARPSSCRSAPFHWNMNAKMFWDSAKSWCEGVNQGPLISESEILAKLRDRKPHVYPGRKETETTSPASDTGDPRYAED